MDWEFTCTAPAEFIHAPPWWLLLEKPEYWTKGLGDWCIQYERRLEIFLNASYSIPSLPIIDSLHAPTASSAILNYHTTQQIFSDHLSLGNNRHNRRVSTSW